MISKFISDVIDTKIVRSLASEGAQKKNVTLQIFTLNI